MPNSTKPENTSKDSKRKKWKRSLIEKHKIRERRPRLTPSLVIADEREAYFARYFSTLPPASEKKRAAMDFLGGFCACCGESVLDMLTVDHIHNDGYTERRGNIINKVLSSNDRAKYQALCLNCNHAKGNGRECDHQKKVRALIWENVVRNRAKAF